MVRVPMTWEAIIKVNRADDANKRGRDIHEGLSYACALLVDEYGWNSANVRDALEEIAAEAEAREENSHSESEA